MHNYFFSRTSHYIRLLGIIVLVTFVTQLGADTHSSNRQMNVSCQRHEVIIKSLKNDYGEELIAWGKSESSDEFSLYSNKRTKEYTLIRTSKFGSSCILDVGKELRIR